MKIILKLIIEIIEFLVCLILHFLLLIPESTGIERFEDCAFTVWATVVDWFTGLKKLIK